jgi:transposase, IS30 family
MASHLTPEEREIIAHVHRNGAMQIEIAKNLKRDKSTISRELRRNRSRNGYWAVSAQRKAETRRSQRPWTAKMARPEIGRYVRQRLRKYWSPGQIAGRLRKEFPHERRRRVSQQTIYAWIEGQGKAGECWRHCLRRKGRKRSAAENRGRIPASKSIDGRPAIVDRRGRYGDWEGDTVGEIMALGRRAIAYGCDVSEEAAVHATVEQIQREFDRIVILSKIAGITARFPTTKIDLATALDGVCLGPRGGK